jgi:dTDP-4-amino-4,6-dideoxygalactose transaminase
MAYIPFIDLQRQNAPLIDDIYKHLNDIIQESDFINGKIVTKLEERLCSYYNVLHTACVGSGTAAIFLALKALGIGEGDEVIIPTNTFIATAWAVCQTNATPIFVDCNLNDYTIQVEDIEGKLSKKTKAIIGVHLFGNTFNIEKVQETCKRYNLFMIEDCAQAFGSKYKDKFVGTYGDAGCFSFYPTKNLGAFGEAGAVMSSNQKIHTDICKIKNQGSSEKYIHDAIGYNYRLDSIQAAVLYTKLNHVEMWNQQRRSIAHIYIDNIKNKKLKNPNWNENGTYHLFVLLAEDRDKLIDHLSKCGIGYGIHYPVCCHLQKPFIICGYKKGDFNKSEYFSDHCISIPIYPELTENEISAVIHALNTY